tara:strand:+ start:1233 stop:1430 length:198 start_codon:yes stop_codon:yes gene_type:complete
MKTENNYTLRSHKKENGKQVYTLEKNGIPLKQSNSFYDLFHSIFSILSDKNNNIKLEVNHPKNNK